MKQLGLMTVLLALAGPAVAAPETYLIDSSRTSSEFSYRYLGVADQTHRFERVRGEVVFDPAARTGSADVTIDVASVDTGNALLNERMQDADFFDSARYPTITFRSGRMALDGEQASLIGDLTIKGVTRPVTLAVSQFQCRQDPVFKVDACGARASVTIRRSDFNLGKYPYLVSNDVTLNLAIQAVKDTPALQLANRDPGS